VLNSILPSEHLIHARRSAKTNDVGAPPSVFFSARSSSERAVARRLDYERARRRLITVVDKDGNEVRLNANHIRAVKVHDPSMPLIGLV